MATIKEYLDYAELAQASYVNGLQKGMIGEGYKVDKDNIFVKAEEFSPLQAENFASRYRVLATSQEYGIGGSSGLDAVLFKDTVTGKTILSIRGTSSLSDVYSDFLLAKYGVAYDQTNDLNLFYETLINNNVITSTDIFDVTGHSLGGVLAQVFSATNPNIVNNTYTYNAPGIGGLEYQAYENLGLNPADFAYTNITNIYAKDGVEVTSGLGAMLGKVLPISIDDGYLVQNHFISRLTESLNIYNMLSSIAGSNDINTLTNILSKISNQKTVDIIKDLFQTEVSGDTVDQTISLSEKYKGKATGIISLIDKSLSQLNSKDPATLYALLHVNPFAIEGNLNVYNEINPDEYSDMQMDDLSQMLYSSMHKEHKSGYVYKNLITGESVVNAPSINQVMFGGDDDNLIRGESGDDTYYVSHQDIVSKSFKKVA